MSMERVLEGVDAARRVAWAQKYAADERIQELEAEIQRLRARLTAPCDCKLIERIKAAAAFTPMTRNALCDKVGGSRNRAWTVVNLLIEQGDLVRVSRLPNDTDLFACIETAEAAQ